MRDFSKSQTLRTAGVLFICSIVAIPAVVSYLDPFNKRLYDRNSWLDSEPRQRAAMARDALKHSGRLGISTDEVLYILGEPEEVIRSPTDSGGNPMIGDITYSYYLGGWSAIGYDDEFLYIHIDSNGRVLCGEINGY